MAMVVEPLSNALGAAITGVDLNDPAPGDIAAIEQALADHLVVAVRDQTLTADGLIAVARRFGDISPQHMTDLMMRDHPEICVIDSRKVDIGDDGRPKLVGSDCWHTDHTNYKKPPKYTFLYAVQLPPSGGGDTGFANMQKAFDRLDAAEQERLLGMRTINALVEAKSYTRAEDLTRYGEPCEHPLIRTHPISGKKAIYFHPTKVDKIVGMERKDSRALVYDLQARTIDESTTYIHRWRPKDLVIWDNRGVMHKAFDNYDHREGRVMHRVLVEGEVPF